MVLFKRELSCRWDSVHSLSMMRESFDESLLLRHHCANLRHHATSHVTTRTILFVIIDGRCWGFRLRCRIIESQSLVMAFSDVAVDVRGKTTTSSSSLLTQLTWGNGWVCSRGHRRCRSCRCCCGCCHSCCSRHRVIYRCDGWLGWFLVKFSRST